MSQNSNIEWTHDTFNPWEGCDKVSPGCAHCYAETRNARYNRGKAINWGKGVPRRRTSEANWKLPIKWDRQSSRDRHEFESTGKITDESGSVIATTYTRRRVFCASLADWLDDEVPIEWLADLLDLIRLTPNLDWLLLTKRPENWKPRLKQALAHNLRAWGNEPNDLADWIDGWRFKGEPPANVWIGTTVEDQARADERIPLLLSIPANVRFLSCEPLLEPVDLGLECKGMHHGSGRPDCPRELHHHCDYKCAGKNLHWVITGGESGAKCRHFSADWARDLRDQCRAAGAPFFMKQMGGTRKPFPEIPPDLMIRQFPTLT